MKKIFSQIQYHVAYKRKHEKKYHIISNNINSWCADPFPFEYKGSLYIFAEYFLSDKEKGAIAYTQYNGTSFGKWTVIIEEDYHLSFPNIFEKDGEIFILPESSASQKMYFYKCVHFPDKWVKTSSIATGKYVDTVLLDHNNKTYGFTYKLNDTIPPNGSLLTFELKENNAIFSDKSLITNNDAVARPAGKFIVHSNKLYRVSQDCNGSYGKAVVISEVFLSKASYKEEVIHRITPQNVEIDKKYNYIGLHTYNETDDFQIIDLRSYDTSIFIFFWKVINKISRSIRKYAS